MAKWFNKIDFTLVFRLSLSVVMGIVWYTQKDMSAGVFALFLAVYALLAAKYKVGCGYNACGYTPTYSKKDVSKQEA